MAHPPLPSLVHALLTLCDDVFFTITATLRLDAEVLRALAKRRAPVVTAAAKGARPDDMSQGDAWLVRLAAAIAPLAPPRFMPMADVIEEGVSLELGARGVRSLFTSKPSEKDVARVRTLGAFSLRALTSVLSATGGLRPEAALARSSFVVSLGLPEEEQRAMLEEAPVAIDSLEIPAGLEPKIARAVLRGGFAAAMFEGDDPREEQAVLVLGRKTTLPAEDITAAHGDARRLIDMGRAFGEACVDALRFVLGDDAEELERIATMAARLTLPKSARGEVAEAVRAGGPVVLAKKHALDRRGREAALGLVWASALRSNPSYVRRAELAVRHDKVAADLGDEDAGAEARRVVETFLNEEVRAAVPLAPPPMPSTPEWPGGGSPPKLLP